MYMDAALFSWTVCNVADNQLDQFSHNAEP